MKVKLIPEGKTAESYPTLSSLDNLLVKYPDEMVKEKGARWDSRKLGSYEIMEK